MIGPRPTELQVGLEHLRRARAHSTSLIDDLSDDQVRWRPHVDSSAIGWHLGHQAAVAHFMVRNLTAAEPSIDVELDRLFDSATPEPRRDPIPSVAEILAYRDAVERALESSIGRIAAGDVGAPRQLALVGHGLLVSLVNHEYQHATWIAEVRAALGATPVSGLPDGVSVLDGYPVLVASGRQRNG